MPLLKREPEFYPRHLFEGLGVGSPWWVAHVRSRREKQLARHLLEHRVRYYLPQREHRLRSGGRVRRSYLPLFPGYVFFQGDLRDRAAAVKSNIIVRVLDVMDAEVLYEELRTLWRLEVGGVPLVPYPHLGPGDWVEVAGGPFKECRGTVVREKGRDRLVVSISLLRQSVAAEFDRDTLVPFRKEPVHA